MDLRVKRTTKNIKDAFFELRKKKSLDKISVKELSELAMINKATFYLHYRDIYELSDTLENELIERIISDVHNINLTKENLKWFTENLSRSILKNNDYIETLFSGYDDNQFINHLEISLKSYIFQTFPWIKNNSENNILLSFLIQGSFRTYIRNSNIDKDVLLDTTSNIMMRILSEYTF